MDVLRQNRTFGDERFSLFSLELRRRNTIIAKYEKEFKSVMSSQRKESLHIHKQALKEEKRKQKEEAKKKRAMEREHQRKIREKKKKLRSKKKKSNRESDEDEEEEKEEPEDEEEEEEKEDVEESEADEADEAEAEDEDDNKENEAENGDDEEKDEEEQEGLGEEDQEDGETDSQTPKKRSKKSLASDTASETSEANEKEEIDDEKKLPPPKVNYRMGLLPINPDKEGNSSTIYKYALRDLAEVMEELSHLRKGKPDTLSDDNDDSRSQASTKDIDDDENEDEENEAEKELDKILEIDVLTIAVSQGAIDCVAILLAKGANTTTLEEYFEITCNKASIHPVKILIEAAHLSDRRYGYQVKMNLSWLFRSVLPEMPLKDAENLVYDIIKANIRPKVNLDDDDLNSGREVYLFCQMLRKLSSKDYLIDNPSNKDSEENEEEEEEEEVELDGPAIKHSKIKFKVPSFIASLLSGGPIELNMKLENPRSSDIIIATVKHKVLGFWKELKYYWSDIMLLLLALEGNSEKFSQLLMNKKAITREYGKPAGTWDLLYKNCFVLSQEMLDELIKANPVVFSYFGGVVIEDFVKKQWDSLSIEFRRTLIHHFYNSFLLNEKPLNLLPGGPNILAQSLIVKGQYDYAIGLLKSTETGPQLVDKLKTFIHTNNLALFTPYYLLKAVISDNLPVISYMLDNGCPDQIREEECREPRDLLRYALENKKFSLVLLLVDRGADLHAHWDNGKTTPMKYIQDHYNTSQYNELLVHWKKSEFERNASKKYMFGILKKQVAVGA
eukprot:NODE_664_length_2489_cov_5.464497_g569_i0.p1 GENE.NODE_664_length_2489_cov_5.464497_g569_i0~~NODE_664_length_2489_cov_5.464497_g569_i0.p1  ORF type:complete len:804 (-),score=207.92 NODE_664_length_2489_cov_5.464497_g569_i0:77-2434(-)